MPICGQKGAGDYFCHGDRKQQAGIGHNAARQIADVVDRIPHTTYVEPFLGRGDIFRAVKPSDRMIVSDLDCSRVKQAREHSCPTGGGGAAQCAKLEQATVSCGTDWRAQLKHDSPGTLFVLDPPWEGIRHSYAMNYDRNAPIAAREVADRTRGLKGSVAIVYRDAAETRKALCTPPFKCHLIRRQFFGRKFTQLLAVKGAAR